jgi:hypothetical protein
MSIRDFLRQSRSILGQPHLELVEPSASQRASSVRWSRGAMLLSLVALLLFLVYWLTNLLPGWFGYVIAPVGMAAWFCQIQSQESLRAHRSTESE